jgi:hypothetical protein
MIPYAVTPLVVMVPALVMVALAPEDEIPLPAAALALVSMHPLLMIVAPEELI